MKRMKMQGVVGNLMKPVLIMVVILLGFGKRAEAIDCCADNLTDPEDGSRIVGGRTIPDIRERPYAVQIIKRSPGPYCWAPDDCDTQPYWYAFHCTGTIVSRIAVVTAWHCVAEPNSTIHDYFVLAGVAQVHGNSPYTSDPQFSQADWAWASGEGKLRELGTDIALLLFIVNPFNITDYVKPMKLLGYSREEYVETHAKIVDKTSCTINGWGSIVEHSYNEIGELKPLVASEILKTVQMDKWSYNDCRNSSRYSLYYTVLNHTVCIASPSGDEGFCDGDSGAGLICGDRLVAVVSWARKCNSPWPQFCSSLEWLTELMDDVLQCELYPDECEAAFEGYMTPRSKNSTTEPTPPVPGGSTDIRRESTMNIPAGGLSTAPVISSARITPVIILTVAVTHTLHTKNVNTVH